MASGGPPPSRLTLSEPRHRGQRYRLSNPDMEDARSVGSSTRLDDRPNNWDSLDWQPSTVPVDAYPALRRETKKENQEREQEQEQRGQSLSQESTPQDSSKHRHRTPSTYPRVAAASHGQRRAMENIRQRINFSDADEPVSESGKNNERYPPLVSRDWVVREPSLERNVVGAASAATATNNVMMPRGRTVEGAATAVKANRITNFNVDQEGPDSNQLVGRLMQIRDYIKQTTSMMQRMERSTDPDDQYRIFQFEQVIQRLKDQEQQYLAILLDYSKSKESCSRLTSLIDSLKEQERGYLNLLQKVLAAREDDLLLRQNSTESVHSKQGTDSEATSELDVPSDTTADTEEEEPEEEEVDYRPVVPENMRLRPMIEDRLGRHSDTELEELGQLTAQLARHQQGRPTRSPLTGATLSAAARGTLTVAGLAMGGLDSTLIAENGLDDADDDDETTPIAAELKEQRVILESDLASKNEELQALRDQHTLLKQMVQQQEQLRTLKGRESALREMQMQAQEKLAEERAAAGIHNGPDMYMEDTGSATSTATTNTVPTTPAPSEEVDGARGGMEFVPQELLELRKKLDELRKIYDMKSQTASGVSQDSVSQAEDVTESEMSEMSAQRSELQDKLVDLQQKKDQMDKLLQELQSLRDMKMRPPHLGAGVDGDHESLSSSQFHFSEGVLQTVTAEKTAGDAENMLEMMETRRKLRKLKDVKERLNQLKDLVQYYQMSSEFIHGAGGDPDGAGTSTGETIATVTATEEQEDASSLPMYSDYEDPQATATSRSGRRDTDLEKLLDQHQAQKAEAEAARKVLQQISRSTQAAATTPSDNSDANSSLGGWGDDPDIQEKVGRLKAAKDKLHRLQDLIGLVQNTPEALAALPSDLAADLAASLEDGDTSGLAALRQQMTSMAQEMQNMGQMTAESRSSRPPERPRLSPAAAATAAVNEASTRATAAASEDSQDPREQFYQNKMLHQQAELEGLVDERNRLMSIQQELQRLHDALATEEQMAAGAQGASSDTRDRGTDDCDKDSRDLNAESKSMPETVQVTFGEPLETVISNEELYGQMRQQRILREELREKKKELEKFMKKDRPKKHYFRNQDNQSDNVSYSNKSDQYGASASEDVTMATWGGSTAGNLESIEEDGSGEGQVIEEEDDGYPSDGIVQVEEEEEAHDDSDDRDTYTIEDEYSSKRKPREQPAPVDDRGSRGARAKRSRGAPYAGRSYDNPYSYNHWAPDNNQVLNNVRSTVRRSEKPEKKVKRRRARKAEPSSLEIEVSNLQTQVQMLSSRLPPARDMPSLLLPQNPDALTSPGSYMSQYQYSNQMVQQQLMMNLQQNYSQIFQQQQEMLERFSRLEQRLTPAIDDPFQRGYAYNRAINRSSSSQQLSASAAQDAQRLESLLIPNTSRNEFELNPQEFQNQYPFPSGGSGGFSSQVDGPVRSFNRENSMNRADDETSYNIPGEGSTPIQLRPERNNPFQMPRMSSSTLYTSRNLSLDRSPDSVQIDTIHAENQRAIERLQEGQGARSKTKTRTQESYKSKKKSPNRSGDEVITRRFPTPSRATAAARLADQQMPPDPMPSLGEASRAGQRYPDQASVSSALSSVPGADLYAEGITREALAARARKVAKKTDESGAPGEMNTFEALRETIYSEVATLISQNEKRPHYLIEMFRELQMLGSDYLRQRALYAIQDLVAKHLTDDDANANKLPGQWLEPPLNPVGEELTPSESMVSLEAEDGRVLRGYVTMGGHPDRSPDTMRGGKFDYVENVETTSTMSTPESHGSHIENPFAQDSLGDTVIHLDKALRKMREYELKLAECDDSDSSNQDNLTVPVSRETVAMVTSRLVEERDEEQGASGGRAPDQASEGSFSDIPESTTDSSESDFGNPRIDTQKLDRQIKNIMAEIIPVLKEHDVCSQQLLQYLKRLVLLLTKQKDEEHEFVRFFHNQLSTSLQDSLSKFEGRKLRECGEDLLVDLSEILFNELAFFRLMQDLDDPKAKAKARIRQWRQDSQTSTDTPLTAEARRAHDDADTSDTDTDTEDDDEGAESDDEGAESGHKDTEDDAGDLRTEDEEEDPLVTSEEQEALGKARDDSFACEVNIEDPEDLNGNSPLRSAMKIELAPSETKPYTRIGSDEDDEGDSDEAASCDDPSETAVSRDAEMERRHSATLSEGNAAAQAVLAERVPDDLPEGDVEVDASAQTPATQVNGEVSPEEAERVNHVNGEVGEDDLAEVTLADLPARLTTLTKEELESKMSEEQRDNALSGAVMDAVSPTPGLGGDAELAGDPQAVQPPPGTPVDPAARQL